MAAQRFVRYWSARREVFGEDKFVEKMTLSEALRDDLVALEAGMCCLLPYPDLSGRQVIYVEPKRHTREGYTSESMVRSCSWAPQSVSRVIVSHTLPMFPLFG